MRGVPFYGSVMSLLKEQFFKKDTINALGQAMVSVYPAFDVKQFRKVIWDRSWESLELLDRMHRVTEALHACLPKSYAESLKILSEASVGYEGFEGLVFPDFVQKYGMDHLELSVEALEEFTSLCTSEFGVRPFIEKNPDYLFKRMLVWAKSENEHVRRLASEGCRPRLPWSSALPFLKKDPSRILPVLELLKADSSLYVRKSVANNLNDISKDNPDTVIQLVKSWKGLSKETDWIIKHGCRTMLKQGRSDVLRLFGFSSPKSIEVSSPMFSNKKVKMGESIHFDFIVKSKKGSLGKIRVEYVIDFVKANGKTSPKVFQVCERMEDEKSELPIKKKHGFQEMTTRKHYAGVHKFSIRVNGVIKSSGEIELCSK